MPPPMLEGSLKVGGCWVLKGLSHHRPIAHYAGKGSLPMRSHSMAQAQLKREPLADHNLAHWPPSHNLQLPSYHHHHQRSHYAVSERGRSQTYYRLQACRIFCCTCCCLGRWPSRELGDSSRVPAIKQALPA